MVPTSRVCPNTGLSLVPSWGLQGTHNCRQDIQDLWRKSAALSYQVAFKKPSWMEEAPFGRREALDPPIRWLGRTWDKVNENWYLSYWLQEFKKYCCGYHNCVQGNFFSFFFSFAIPTLAEEISKKLHLGKTGSHSKFSFSPFAFSKER